MNLSSFKLTNINELISVYKENPERFNRFYNAVYLCWIAFRNAEVFV